MASLTAAFLALSFGERAFVCALATLCINLSAARCTLCMVSHRASAAASYGVVVILLGAVNVVGYSSDSRLLLPIVIAGWFGTYVAVRRAAPSFARATTAPLAPELQVIARDVPQLNDLSHPKRGIAGRSPEWVMLRFRTMHRFTSAVDYSTFRLTQRLRYLLR